MVRVSRRKVAAIWDHSSSNAVLAKVPVIIAVVLSGLLGCFLGMHLGASPPSSEIVLSPDTCSIFSTKNFDGVYETAQWGAEIQPMTAFYNNANWPPKQRHSASGIGSDLGSSTVPSLRILIDTIRTYNLSSMMDVPCGDGNWIFDSVETDVLLDAYIGLDIVKPVIDVNQQRFRRHTNKVFRHWDGAGCCLPKFRNDMGQLQSAELVHVRDALMHLPLKLGMKFVCNVLTSGARFFVTTTHPGETNKDVPAGGWYPNDMKAPPFSFPDVPCTVTHPDQKDKDETCVFDMHEGTWVQEWLKRESWCEGAFSAPSTSLRAG